MILRELASDDLPLYQRMYTDPVVMAELGGVQSRGGVPKRLEKGLAVMRDGTGLVLTVWDEDDAGEPVAAGIVCYFRGEIDDEPTHEVGWMLLPEFWGRGLATRATAALIERAREDAAVSELYAMTSAANGPSNAICAKLGFVHVDDRPMEYDGQTWPGRLWRLDV